MLFANAAHKVMEDTGNPDAYTGTSKPSLGLINNYIRGTSIEGKSGPILLDVMGERGMEIEVAYVRKSRRPARPSPPRAKPRERSRASEAARAKPAQKI
jgi:hypothetical protein